MARRIRPPRSGALSELPPLKILRQIFVLQTIWYFGATVLILFSALVAGKRFTLDMVLSWRSLRGDTTVGWMLGIVWLLNALVGVVFILLVIARSKLVLDFALTLHFIHLLVTSFYSKSIPQNWLWWVLQITSAALMTSLGAWSCQWRELRPINFGGSKLAEHASPAPGPSNVDDGTFRGDEELGGYERGRGRGRGRGKDGAGEYEMVGMNTKTESPG